jgi:outer membrane protein
LKHHALVFLVGLTVAVFPASAEPVIEASQATTAPITAAEAARMALERNPSLMAMRADVEAARGRTGQANSFLLPILSASGAYARNNTFGGSGSTLASAGGSLPAGWQGSLSVRQLAFDFDKTRALAREAAASERATSAAVSASEARLVLQVKQAFYTLVQDQKLTQAYEASLASSNEHLALARAREKEGLGLPVDVSRAEAAVAESQLQLTVARNDVAQARIALATLMGVDPRTPFATADSGEKDVKVEGVTALVDLALKRRPEIVSVRAAIDAAVQGERSARVTNAPSFYVAAGLSAKGNDWPPNNNAGTVGVSVQWSPFDSGYTAGAIRQARANADATRAQLAAAQQAAVTEVTAAYLNVQSARQRVTTADLGVKSAEDSMRLTEGRYRAGVGTFIAVTDAQAALVTARAHRISAGVTVDIALAALQHAIGEPVR